MTTNTSNKRRKLPTTRIGKASVGRTLLILMENLITSHMSAESMRTTMRAVYIYLHSQDILIDGSLDTRIFTLMKNEIDLSFDRSQKARARAAFRKAAREAASLATPQASSDVSDGENHLAIEQTVPAVTSDPTTEDALTKPDTANPSTGTPTKSSDTINPSSHEPTKKRRPVRDPDAPAFTYRPPATNPPKAYVITEEDGAKPYDPYGVRKAFEMQKVHRLVRSNW